MPPDTRSAPGLSSCAVRRPNWSSRKATIQVFSTVSAIQNYARTAGMLVSGDRNSIEVQREVSLAKLTTIRQQALEKTKPFKLECSACAAKTTIDVASPDYKAAVAAQKHMDEISGVLVKQAPSVQITVNPAFGQLWGAMSRMLEAKHPEAYADCSRLLTRFDDELRRRETIDVADEPMLEAG